MLAYETLEAAEAYLGRNLTFAEGLWFSYSAHKSDYILYCHNTLFLFFFYTILPLPYLILDLFPSNKFRSFKIQPKMHNSLADMLACYKKVILTFLISVGPLQIFSYPLIQVFLIQFKLLNVYSLFV